MHLRATEAWLRPDTDRQRPAEPWDQEHAAQEHWDVSICIVHKAVSGKAHLDYGVGACGQAAIAPRGHDGQQGSKCQGAHGGLHHGCALQLACHLVQASPDPLQVLLGSLRAMT